LIGGTTGVLEKRVRVMTVEFGGTTALLSRARVTAEEESGWLLEATALATFGNEELARDVDVDAL
jgi:hypothetical protein